MDSENQAAEATPRRRTRLGRWLRTKPAPVASLITAVMVFSLAITLFFLLDVVWPAEATSWVDNLVLAAALAIGMGVGEAVAEWRYGRDILYRQGAESWRAFALYLLIIAALVIGLSELAGLLID